jgi:hypothetical protein
MDFHGVAEPTEQLMKIKFEKRCLEVVIVSTSKAQRKFFLVVRWKLS